MPLTFCLLTKDPSQSPQDPSCRHTRNRLTFGTHPPRARGAMGAASCTLQRTGVLPPKAPGSLCYREFHLCDELSHFDTAGFVISPSKRKYLDSFELSRQAVKVFLEGRDILGSQTDYLSEITLAFMVCGKAGGIETRLENRPLTHIVVHTQP